MSNSRHAISENRVHVGNDDVIVNVYVGDQTPETIRQVSQRTIEHIKALHSTQKPGHVLVDLTHMGRTSAAGRLEAVETLKAMPCDKVALYGGTIYVKHLARLIIIAAGQSHRVQYFDTEEAARTWLLAVRQGERS